MKIVIVLFTILFACLFSAEYATAQTGPRVMIHNTSGQHRRVCMYRDKDTAMKSPYKCFSMNSNQKVGWDRKGDRAYFRIKAMRQRGSIYETVSYRRLPGKTTTISVTSRGIAYDTVLPKPPVAEHSVKICNKQWDREIYVALSFETNEHYRTEGWWGITKGKCFEVGVNDRLKNNTSFIDGKPPKIYYYAEMHSSIPRFWGGGPNALSLCVPDTRAFEIQFPRKDAPHTECGFGQNLAKFGLLTPRPGEIVTYNRSF